MKAKYPLLAAILALAVSCNDRMDVQGSNVHDEVVTIKAVQAVDDASRTSLVDGGSVWWNPGDDLSLFYGSGADGGSRFTADITEPAPIANFTGIIDVVTGGGEISMEDTWFWATYPYNANASCDGSSIVTELPCSQVGKAGTFSDGMFITVAKSQGLLMSFYNVCSGLKFSVTNPEVKSVRIKSNGGEPIAGKARVAFDASGVPYISEVLEGTDEITISAPDGGCFEAGQNYYITMLPQTLAGGFTVTFETWYEQGTREIVKKATFKRAVFNTMASADKDVTYTQKPTGVEYVDLGLSVKWATCNLGATKPEDYGGYYQWAGLEDVTSTSIYLDWSNCPYHTGSSDSTGWTKYIPLKKPSYWSGSGSPDNKTVLDPEDDAAYVKLGGKWRMPTDAEWAELINTNNCNWIWTTQNGVNGYRITSNKSGYTGQSIFLPAAGRRYGMDLKNVSARCDYWSSSLSTASPRSAYYVYFRQDDDINFVNYYRYYGRSVRPVYGDRTGVSSVRISTSSLTLIEGETQALTATITPSNAAEKSVSWSSNNTSVVTVDASGKVTAVKAGSATITVTTTDGGHTATCSVTVSSGPTTTEWFEVHPGTWEH